MRVGRRAAVHGRARTDAGRSRARAGTPPTRLRRALASTPLPRAADGRIVPAADVSPWLRPAADICAPGLLPQFGRGEGKHQTVPGRPYQPGAGDRCLRPAPACPTAGRRPQVSLGEAGRCTETIRPGSSPSTSSALSAITILPTADVTLFPTSPGRQALSRPCRAVVLGRRSVGKRRVPPQGWAM